MKITFTAILLFITAILVMMVGIIFLTTTVTNAPLPFSIGFLVLGLVLLIESIKELRR
jgi:hypothetical protein